MVDGKRLQWFVAIRQYAIGPTASACKDQGIKEHEDDIRKHEEVRAEGGEGGVKGVSMYRPSIYVSIFLLCCTYLCLVTS